MAAAQQQLLAQVQNQNQEPLPSYKMKLFGDIPSADGKMKLIKFIQWAHGVSRGGSSLGTNFEGTDPGFGGVGNPTVQAQHTDRNTASFHAALSTIEVGSQLYQTVSVPPFTTGREIYLYLDSPNIVYLRPPDSEAQEHIRKTTALTWQDLSPELQASKDVNLHFKAMITGHNPNMHPNMNITRNQMINTFCNGAHPEAKVVAIEIRDDIVLAAQKGCCYPAVWPAGHPLAPNAHPNAGTLSLDLMAIYVHKQFCIKLNAGVFRLKGQPAVNLVSELPVPDQDTTYVSVDDALSAGYHDFNQYMYFVMNKNPPTYLLRTCIKCGGINHMALKCATPDGSVSEEILRMIRYPLGVRPWIFKDKGKGNKGRGFGNRGNGRGGRFGIRGKGGYRPPSGAMAMWQAFEWVDEAEVDESVPGLPSGPSQESDEPSSDSAPSQPAQETHDDYDGWNTWE